MNCYAGFLEKIPNRRVEAETFYKRAIDLSPQDAPTIHNYARFLAWTVGRPAQAEAFYKRAIYTDPQKASYLCNYAHFLWVTSNRQTEAETFFKQAIDAEPLHADSLSKYAEFLLLRHVAHKFLKDANPISRGASLESFLIGIILFSLSLSAGVNNFLLDAFKAPVDCASRDVEIFGKLVECCRLPRIGRAELALAG